ncbi:MAG: 30S ribosomal protein S6 [Chloroflexi bacterium]|nr:30S ribosomal protein S6 [Chloroflexota bacterium]
MRRYELMLVLRPDLAEDRVQATLDRITRSISAADGELVKVSPWGRRRLAYQIGAYREGSYYIVLFDAPPAAVEELERGLRITEELLRFLVTRVERPAARRSETETGPSEEEEEPQGEFIDESESEAAPAAID